MKYPLCDRLTTACTNFLHTTNIVRWTHKVLSLHLKYKHSRSCWSIQFLLQLCLLDSLSPKCLKNIFYCFHCKRWTQRILWTCLHDHVCWCTHSNGHLSCTCVCVCVCVVCLWCVCGVCVVCVWCVVCVCVCVCVHSCQLINVLFHVWSQQGDIRQISVCVCVCVCAHACVCASVCVFNKSLFQKSVWISCRIFMELFWHSPVSQMSRAVYISKWVQLSSPTDATGLQNVGPQSQAKGQRNYPQKVTSSAHATSSGFILEVLWCKFRESWSIWWNRQGKWPLCSAVHAEWISSKCFIHFLQPDVLHRNSGQSLVVQLSKQKWSLYIYIYTHTHTHKMKVNTSVSWDNRRSMAVKIH